MKNESFLGPQNEAHTLLLFIILYLDWTQFSGWKRLNPFWFTYFLIFHECFDNKTHSFFFFKYDKNIFSTLEITD